MNTSSGAGRSMWGGQQRQMAITSRWKCMVALGMPVVPEVKPRMHVSSSAVPTVANGCGYRSIERSRLSGPW